MRPCSFAADFYGKKMRACYNGGTMEAGRSRLWSSIEEGVCVNRSTQNSDYFCKEEYYDTSAKRSCGSCLHESMSLGRAKHRKVM